MANHINIYCCDKFAKIELTKYQLYYYYYYYFFTIMFFLLLK